mmetsp:Transcript_105706/g.329447  ORF Transcript_105706/g.329447 Transcript_105706/m.329447 type:complete len:326 (-) Transcript_105706:674-1651(-)
MGDPLHSHEAEVEVRGLRQAVRQDAEDREGLLRDVLEGDDDGAADHGDQQHEDDLEPEVPVLELVLSPSTGPQDEELVEYDHEDGGQKAQEQGQGEGGQDSVKSCLQPGQLGEQAIDRRILVADVLQVRDAGDGDRDGHEADVEPQGAQVPEPLHEHLLGGVALQVPPADVRGLGRDRHDELVGVRGELQAQGDLPVLLLLEGHKRGGRVRVLILWVRAEQPRPFLGHLRPGLRHLLAVVLRLLRADDPAATAPLAGVLGGHRVPQHELCRLQPRLLLQQDVCPPHDVHLLDGALRHQLPEVRLQRLVGAVPLRAGGNVLDHDRG